MPTKSFHRTDRVSAQLRRDLGHDRAPGACASTACRSISVSDVEISRDLAARQGVRHRRCMPERAPEAVKAPEGTGAGTALSSSARAVTHAPRAGAAFPLRRFGRQGRAHRQPAARCSPPAADRTRRARTAEPKRRLQIDSRDASARQRAAFVAERRRYERSMSKTAAAPSFRPLDGILLLDKPPGLSSNQALQRVRHLFRAEKGGHTGSLDPLATGLLPVCFGEATKIAGHAARQRARPTKPSRDSGVTTDTDDADGQPLRERAGAATRRRRRSKRALAPLRRPHPPAPADLFRRSSRAASRCTPRPAAAKSSRCPSARSTSTRIESARAAMQDRWLRLRVDHAAPGTYVRSLVRDLGEALGCGAHVRATCAALWVEPFREPRMCTPGCACSELRRAGRTDARRLPAADRGRPGRLARMSADRRRRPTRASASGQTACCEAGETTAWCASCTTRPARCSGLAAAASDGKLRAQPPVPLGRSGAEQPTAPGRLALKSLFRKSRAGYNYGAFETSSHFNHSTGGPARCASIATDSFLRASHHERVTTCPSTPARSSKNSSACANDTGSPEVQVALLSARIEHLHRALQDPQAGPPLPPRPAA